MLCETREGRNVQVHSTPCAKKHPPGLISAWCTRPLSQEATTAAGCCWSVLSATCAPAASTCARVAEILALSRSSSAACRVLARVDSSALALVAAAWDSFAAAAGVSWAAWGAQPEANPGASSTGRVGGVRFPVASCSGFRGLCCFKMREPARRSGARF